MRMIPIDEIKSIDVKNSEDDKCPYGMSLPDDDVSCRTNNCMAWYWTSDGFGCCALIYKPEIIQLEINLVEVVCPECKYGFTLGESAPEGR